MELLKQKALKPERGDVIIFNNTSAEHPATYKFARKMKLLAEEKYNIPFFWIEYQTYEDASRSYQWSRKPSYRLVNDQPYSLNNETGYRYKGEVFEEVISFSGYLPNRMSRTCTQSMKIFTTNSFLSDWFAQKTGIERLGHHGEKQKVTDDDILRIHRNNGGSVPDSILLEKKRFSRECNFIREQQRWSDFTKADIAIDNKALKDSVLGDKAQLYGDLAVEYVSCLGIRVDEQRRAIKIKRRIDDAQGETGKSLFNQPQGETILAPLISGNVTKEEVVDFWEKQDFNLALPNTGLFSNCLYCPLKGKAKLLEIATKELKNKPSKITPASIDWWIKIEKKYSRDLLEENRKISSEKEPAFVGFFGATKEMVFESIKKLAEGGASVDKEMLELESDIPCNCTD